jgi:SOS response regulatory protein OraA/RecX
MAERRRVSPAEKRDEKAAIDDPEVVLAAALRFLEARSRSVAEVRTRLTRAGYRPELIEAAVVRLIDIGMLDDAAFARQWVESRDRAHPRGEHALIVELRQKGIDAAVIAATIKDRREADVRWEDRSPVAPEDHEASPRDPDLAAARKLLERHSRALQRFPDPRIRRMKAYALLARSGFDPDTCREIAAEVNVRPAEEPVDAADDGQAEAE